MRAKIVDRPVLAVHQKDRDKAFIDHDRAALALGEVADAADGDKVRQVDCGIGIADFGMNRTCGGLFSGGGFFGRCCFRFFFGGGAEGGGLVFAELAHFDGLLDVGD